MRKVTWIDLGERKRRYYVLNEGEIAIEEGTVQTAPAAFAKHFAVSESSLIGLEVYVHSPWASRVLGECGHKVLVANKVRLQLVHKSSSKSDRVDTCALAPRRIQSSGSSCDDAGAHPACVAEDG